MAETRKMKLQTPISYSTPNTLWGLSRFFLTLIRPRISIIIADQLLQVDSGLSVVRTSLLHSQACRLQHYSLLALVDCLQQPNTYS